ncbi:molybdate ABC transporter permease subunit [Peribacillus sp. SCS-155]|uniref:molybdate ABC transporter permease subunit n=1 Tax=Peribacillus sedimenti TaxID=3115297 RepID=UPI003905CA24
MTAEFWQPVFLSLQVAVISSVIVFAAGLLLARRRAREHGKASVLLETFYLLPLVLPPSVTGFLLIVIFGRNSPVGQGIEWIFNQPVMFTWWAAVIASAVVAFPLMYQSAKTGFEAIDKDIEDAARVDGADEKTVFRKISLPLAGKAIMAGGILSFARALGEFGATLMFAGNIPGKTQTIPTAVYVAIDSGEMAMAWMWVGTMVAISFIMLLLVHFIRK